MSICEKCGQDHHLAIVCIGGSGGRKARHNPETQRRIALKRWADWRKGRAAEWKKNNPKPFTAD